MAPRHRRSRATRRHRGPILVIAAAAVLVAAAGCLVAAPQTARLVDATSLAPSGSVGYVVCPAAVTPVELNTRTAEAPIPLPLTGTPVLGSFAIATSPDGRWAYVATTDRVADLPATAKGAADTSGTGARSPASGGHPSGAGVRDVVVPIDLSTQRALAPIPIPGRGGSHAVVVLPDGRTVLVADGSSIVPVDALTRDVGTPLDLGAGHPVFGMALSPSGTMLYTLVPGGVIPVDVVHATARPEIVTGLSVSSVYSPHGIVVSADGSTVYVAGQGGEDYGGRIMPIQATTGALLPETGFDRFGIADPAALTIAGSDVLVVDAANDWIDPVSLASFSDPAPPVRLPEHSDDASITGTQHPTDIVTGPGSTGTFVVDGFDAVIPYRPQAQAFGKAIPVCSGASSMVVAPAP